MTVSSDVLAAMGQTNNVFSSEVIGQRRFEALEKIYTADAHVLPPGAVMVSGRDRIQSFWEQAVGGLGIEKAQLETVQAEMCGDQVVEIGRAILGLTGGRSVAIKYVVHWKQEGGRWKWAVDIWNANE